MSRTTKKAPTAKKVGTSANELANLFANKLTPRGNGLTSQMKASQLERSFQTALEKMQVQVQKGVYDMDTIVGKASKRLTAIKQAERFLGGRNIKPVSQYDTLKLLYDKDLAHLNEEIFHKDARLQALKFMERSQGPVNDEQREFIVNYYIARANASINVVTEIRDLLVHKKAIKVADKEVKKVEAKAPLADEVVGVTEQA